MNVETLKVDRSKARELHQLYRKHARTPMDAEIRRAYKEIAAGRMVIQAVASIEAAGMFTEGPYVGYPKLALARADSTHVEVHQNNSECVFFSFTPENKVRYGEVGQSYAKDRRFAARIAGSTWKHDARGATMPMIPPHLRPKEALSSYHVLWEAEWSRRVPPRDPYLLRRIGGDMWLVVAAWDLTDVERAAMAHRLSA